MKQGCVLAPTLFGIYLAALLKHAFKDSSEGIFVRTRTDGSMFNLKRLKSKTLTTEVLIRELLFADDAALVAHTNEELQTMLNSLSQACDLFGLQISLKKTEVMGQGTPIAPAVSLKGVTLNAVDSFTYLGSTISTSLDAELGTRIGKAATTFGKLTQRVWANRRLTLRTKVLVYRSCVLTTLLYASETWVIYAKQVRRLNSFHMRCLRKIMGISWQDKVSNVEILQKTGLQSMQTMLDTKRLRWLGHVERMCPNRIPKQVLYGELSQGARKRGRQEKRFKDLCKSSLKDFALDEGTWTTLAADRAKWRSEVKKGARQQEQRFVQRKEEKKAAASQREQQPPSSSSSWPCRFCERICKSRIGLILHEKKCSRTNTSNAAA